MSDAPTITVTGGPPVYNLDKLLEEKQQIESDMTDLEETYQAAKSRNEARLEANAANIEACREILRAHGKDTP